MELGLNQEFFFLGARICSRNLTSAYVNLQRHVVIKNYMKTVANLRIFFFTNALRLGYHGEKRFADIAPTTFFAATATNIAVTTTSQQS